LFELKNSTKIRRRLAGRQMICIAMIVNDYATPETTRTAGFSAFNVRSYTMRAAKKALP
jgi:hypothetical protein